MLARIRRFPWYPLSWFHPIMLSKLLQPKHSCDFHVFFFFLSPVYTTYTSNSQPLTCFHQSIIIIYISLHGQTISMYLSIVHLPLSQINSLLLFANCLGFLTFSWTQHMRLCDSFFLFSPVSACLSTFTEQP